MPTPGDVVLVPFPGATGVKERPSIVVSSGQYHSCRPDVILGFHVSSCEIDDGHRLGRTD